MRKNRIKELREERGLSTYELAEMVGTSQPQIFRLENKDVRQIKQGWLDKIAAALGVSTAEVIGGEAPLELSPQENNTRRLLLINAIRTASKGDPDDIIKSAADMLDRYLIEAEADGDLTEDSLKAAAKTALLSAKQRLQNID